LLYHELCKKVNLRFLLHAMKIKECRGSIYENYNEQIMMCFSSNTKVAHSSYMDKFIEFALEG